MDRKSQIMAPTKKVGGVRRSYKPAAPQGPSLRGTLESFKKEIIPTNLKGFSYDQGDNMVKYSDPSIQLINIKGTNSVCLLVTGDSKVVERDAHSVGLSNRINELYDERDKAKGETAEEEETVTEIHSEDEQ